MQSMCFNVNALLTWAVRLYHYSLLLCHGLSLPDLTTCLSAPGTASNGKEPRPNLPAATECGEGVANRAPHYLQASSQRESADVAEPLPTRPPPMQQQQEVQPAPCDGVGDAGPLCAVGRSTGRVGRGSVEEEQLAPGAEQERPPYSEGKLLQAVLRVPSPLVCLGLAHALAGASWCAGIIIRGNS